MEAMDEKVDKIMPEIDEQCRHVRDTVKRYAPQEPWSKDKEEAEPMEKVKERNGQRHDSGRRDRDPELDREQRDHERGGK
eukprot:8889339-Heterocapsa_arctica.AAC.1